MKTNNPIKRAATKIRKLGAPYILLIILAVLTIIGMFFYLSGSGSTILPGLNISADSSTEALPNYLTNRRTVEILLHQADLSGLEDKLLSDEEFIPTWVSYSQLLRKRNPLNESAFIQLAHDLDYRRVEQNDSGSWDTNVNQNWEIVPIVTPGGSTPGAAPSARTTAQENLENDIIENSIRYNDNLDADDPFMDRDFILSSNEMSRAYDHYNTVMRISKMDEKRTPLTFDEFIQRAKTINNYRRYGYDSETGEGSVVDDQDWRYMQRTISNPATADTAPAAGAATTPQGNTGPNPIDRNLESGSAAADTAASPVASDGTINQPGVSKYVSDLKGRVDGMETANSKAAGGLASNLKDQAESFDKTFSTIPPSTREDYWAIAKKALEDGEKLLGEVIKSGWGDSIKPVIHKEEYEGGPTNEGCKAKCDTTEENKRGFGESLPICVDDGTYDHHNLVGNYIFQPMKCYDPNPLSKGIFQTIDAQSQTNYNQNGVCGKRSKECVANEGLGCTREDGRGKNKTDQMFCGSPTRTKDAHRCTADRKEASCAVEAPVSPDEFLDKQFTWQALGKDPTLTGNLINWTAQGSGVTLPEGANAPLDDAFNNYVTQDWASNHVTADAVLRGITNIDKKKGENKLFDLGESDVSTLPGPQNANLQHPLLYSVKALVKNLDPKNPNGCANDSSLFGDPKKIQQCAFAHAIYNASSTASQPQGAEAGAGVDAGGEGLPDGVNPLPTGLPAGDSFADSGSKGLSGILDSIMSPLKELLGNGGLQDFFGNLFGNNQNQGQYGQNGQYGQQYAFPTQQTGRGMKADVPQLTLKVGERKRTVIIGGKAPYDVSSNAIYRAAPVSGNGVMIEFEGLAVGQAIAHIYSTNNPREAYTDLPVTVTDANGNVYPSIPGQAPSQNNLDQYRPTADPSSGLIKPPTCCLTPGP